MNRRKGKPQDQSAFFEAGELTVGKRGYLPSGRTPTGSTVLEQRSVPEFSLMAKYDCSPAAPLQLNANNVLDRKYYVLDEYGNTCDGAPANVSLSLHLAF